MLDSISLSWSILGRTEAVYRSPEVPVALLLAESERLNPSGPRSDDRRRCGSTTRDFAVVLFHPALRLCGSYWEVRVGFELTGLTPGY